MTTPILSPFQLNLREEPRNIIVRLPNWLGDAVMATPVLHELRQKWPQASITAMAQGAVASLIQEDPNITEIFSFHRPSGWLRQKEKGTLIRLLQQGRYDLGVLLPNSFSSAWWFWRGRVKNRIGYTGHWRRWLLNAAVPFPPNKDKQHLVHTYKQLLEPLGIAPSDSAPRLYLTEDEKIQAKNRLSKLSVPPGATLIGINPGAAYGSAKCWLPERFRELTQRLMENPNVWVLYFGDRAGTPLVKDICADLPERVLNLSNATTIRELMALIDTCSVFLTNDSGPMHIASALGTPLVALFGSTNDTTTGPYGGGLVIHKRVECSPCYRRVCPIDFRCMKQIHVDEVFDALRSLNPGL